MSSTVTLCAVDFTEPSTHALDHALDLAESDADATVHVVHVSESPDVIGAGHVEGVTIDAPTRLQELVDAHLAKRTPLLRPRVRLAVKRAANAAVQIVASAKELQADLIVLATHGRRGFQRWVVGSVAEQVVRTAPCSVLVVRPKQG